jgi:hypothetical protein
MIVTSLWNDYSIQSLAKTGLESIGTELVEC